MGSGWRSIADGPWTIAVNYSRTSNKKKRNTFYELLHLNIYKLMRKLLPSILVLVLSASVFAQQPFRRDDVYGELLGNGIAASLNFERQLTATPGLGARLGIGYFSGDEQFRISIPVGVLYLFPLKGYKSFLDAGVGATWSGAAGLKTIRQEAAAGGRDYNERIWSFVPSLGYRRHTRGNFMWRTSFTPVLNKYRVMPWIGLSVGKRF